MGQTDRKMETSNNHPLRQSPLYILRCIGFANLLPDYHKNRYLCINMAHTEILEERPEGTRPLKTPRSRTLRAVWLAMLLAVILGAAAPQEARAFSLDLDSIAAWGKFPNFCIKTYRWGDKFFNSYDSLYVVVSG